MSSLALQQTAACIVCGEGDPLDHTFAAAQTFYDHANRDNLRPGLQPVELHSTVQQQTGGAAAIVHLSDSSDDDDGGFSLMSGHMDDDDAVQAHWACVKCDRRLKSGAIEEDRSVFACPHCMHDVPVPTESALPVQWWQIGPWSQNTDPEGSGQIASAAKVFFDDITHLVDTGSGADALNILKNHSDVLGILNTFGRSLVASSVRASCIDMIDFCRHNSDVLQEDHAQKRFMEMAIHDSTDEFVRYMIREIILPENLSRDSSADISFLSCCFMGNRLSKALILLEAGANPLESSFEGITSFGYFCGYTHGTATGGDAYDSPGCNHDVEATKDRPMMTGYLSCDRWTGCDVARVFDMLLYQIYDRRPELENVRDPTELMQLLRVPNHGPVITELLNPFSWTSNVCIMHKLLQIGFVVDMPMPDNENVYFRLSLQNCGQGGMEKRLRFLSLHAPNITHVLDTRAMTTLLRREVSYWELQLLLTTNAVDMRRRVKNLAVCVEFLCDEYLETAQYDEDVGANDYVRTEVDDLISALYKVHPEYSSIHKLLNTRNWV